jgi:ABC-type polysaccharide/polyol phosphate transport system ATPase subunit
VTSEIAIRAAGLGKRYNVYPGPMARVKQAFYPRLQRLLPGFLNRMLPWETHPVKLYQEFWSLRGVHFEVEKGETVGIVGRNGSGKSTLLQLACGILTPTEGTVEVQGRTAALLELGAGFNPEFSGRDNVFVNAAVLGLKRHETEGRFDRIVAFSELGDFIDRPVRTYSSGMYVRLAFSVAVHVDPEVLVIDEALAVGDAAFQLKCIERMNAIRDRGTTILFVSHSAEQVKRFCDRAIWLDRGRLLAIGPSALVADEYRDFSASSEAEGMHHMAHGTAPHQELASIVLVECERRELATFETLKVKVTYRVRQSPLPKLLLGVALYDRSGNYVFGPNTHLDGVAIPDAAGEHAVVYRVPRLTLLPGTYYVHVGLFSDGGLVLLDYHGNVVSIKVSADYFAEGALYLDHEWEVVGE